MLLLVTRAVARTIKSPFLLICVYFSILIDSTSESLASKLLPGKDEVLSSSTSSLTFSNKLSSHEKNSATLTKPEFLL